MRRMRMIFGLKVLGLVRWTFAIPGHEFSKFRKLYFHPSIYTHCRGLASINHNPGVTREHASKVNALRDRASLGLGAHRD